MSFAAPNRASMRKAVPMAPMLDVLFLLLIFFATSSTFRAAEQQIDVNLPLAQAAESFDPVRTEVLVNVRPDGALVVSGRQVTVARLRQLLAQLVADFPNERVIIRGDREVPYGRVVEVMDTARAVGIRQVHFATVRPAVDPGSP